MKAGQYTRWTRKEDSLLMELKSAGATYKQISAAIGRGEGGIEHRLRKLGASGERKASGGRKNSGCFTRGNVPWNAGTGKKTTEEKSQKEPGWNIRNDARRKSYQKDIAAIQAVEQAFNRISLQLAGG